MYNIITDNDIKSIVEKPYTLVCGLWHKGCAYIDSVVQQNIIVLEKNPHNPNIAKYQDKGIMVLVGDAKALISQLPFDNLQSIVIVASNDMDNIEIALAFQEALRVQNITAKKLYVHIENHSLQHLYLNDLLHPNNVYANVFSVAKKSVELFFRKNALTGENRNYMESNQPFGVAIVGNTQLASEMIGHIATIANLPNENQITLYCIDKDIESFKNTVQLRFQEIDQISTIRLEYLSLDYQSQAFYTHQVWKENLTHIILCDEAKINLQIATRLLQTSYLIKTIDRKLKTPIHVATYEYDHLSDKLKDHDYIKPFAQTSKVLSFQMLMDSFFDQVAKRLHTHYGKIYEPNRIYNDINEIERRWYQSKPSDRGSTLAQAYHIPIKLEALGLKLQKVESQTEQALLMHNKKIINEVIGEELIEMGLDDNTLSKVTQKKFEQWKTLQEPFEYFPIKFELLIERLIRCEKNRWNAHHYLNGWRYNSNKNKALKQHDCLLPFEDMLPHTKFTVLYDIYTIVYLPNILATIGYQIIKENS